VIANKPATIHTSLGPECDVVAKFGPGSDIPCADERLKIGLINGSHILAFNKFCIDVPQLLLLTLDSYRRQHEPLDLDDIDAALTALHQLPSMYIIFNGGEPAGCSRVHKHMQLLKAPPVAFSLFSKPDADRSKVPFRHFVYRSEKGSGFSATQMYQGYRELLLQARQALGLGSDVNSEPCPHNVVIYQNTIIVIPRRKAYVQGTSANAGGFLGSAWMADEATAAEWISLGPRHVLAELGLPNGNTA